MTVNTIESQKVKFLIVPPKNPHYLISPQPKKAATGGDGNEMHWYIANTLCSEDEEECVPSGKPEKSFPPRLLGNHPESDEKIFLKNGPYGYYVQLGEDKKGYSSKRASISEVKDLKSITVEQAIELLQYPIPLGKHPEDGHEVLLRHSKFGFSVKHRRTVDPVPKNVDAKKAQYG